MRIGLIAWERFSYGGVSRTISSLVNELSKNDDIELKILCLKEEKFFQNVYNIDTKKVEFTFMELSNVQKARREIANRLFEKIVKTGSDRLLYKFPYIKYASSYLKRISSWINKHEFDIVMFSSGFEDSIQLAIIKDEISPEVKLIAWSHASFKDYFREDGGLYSEGIRRLWSYYYKRFDALVVLSDADLQFCKHYLDIDGTRIYNPNSFLPANRSALNTKRFLYVGALSHNKGFDIAIDAFVEFSKVNREWNLDIYGEGLGRKYIEDTIKVHNLKDRIHLYKYTPNVEQVYCEHDILIFPSRYEGFGIVQIEAASCGLPVIAAELPITKELIGTYHYGEIFKWNDSKSLASIMQKLITVDLKPYSDNGITAAKDFDISLIAKDWLSLFNSLTNGKKSKMADA